MKKILLLISGFIFSLVLSLVLIEIGLRLTALIFLARQKSSNMVYLKEKGKEGSFRIVCFGDSNTALGGKFSYPRQLEEILNNRIKGIKFSVINKGRLGEDITSILNHLKYSLDKYEPQMVIIMAWKHSQRIEKLDFHRLLRNPVIPTQAGSDLPAYHITENNVGKSWFENFRFYKLAKIVFGSIRKRAEKQKNYVSPRNDQDEEEILGLQLDVKKNLVTEDVAKLEQRLKEAVGRYPMNAAPYVELGTFYKEQGDYEKAEKLFKEALGVDSRNVSAHLALAWLYKEQENFSLYQEQLEKTIIAIPESGQAHAELGKLFREQGKFSQAEELLNKALILEPQNQQLIIELVNFYKIVEDFSQAQDVIEKALRNNPNNDLLFSELAKIQFEQGGFSQAEESLKKALELNPRSPIRYDELAQFYRYFGKYSKAGDLLKKAINLFPSSAQELYLELAWLYNDQGRFNLAEGAFKAALQGGPADIQVYIELSKFYEDRKKMIQSEKVLLRAIDLSPQTTRLYMILAGFYKNQKRYKDAERMLKKAVSLDRFNTEKYIGLASLYEDMGESQRAIEYSEKAQRIRQLDKQEIRDSFLKIKEILDARKIQLVWVQYPMYKVELLKEIFQAEKRVIFVDNEAIFKEAIKKDGYSEYFLDLSAGNSGHCTAKGNRLLAENIANTLIKEYFEQNELK